MKLIDPREAVAAAETSYLSGRAPLEAVEGFIRQIIGWREYVRGVYWARMPGYATLNFFGYRRPLPPWFWTGKTRMRCLAHAIGQSLTTAYGHHIQRLMVIGNFALLAGLDPHALHQRTSWPTTPASAWPIARWRAWWRRKNRRSVTRRRNA